MRLLPHRLKESLMPDFQLPFQPIPFFRIATLGTVPNIFTLGGLQANTFNEILFLTCEIHFPGSSIENHVVQLKRPAKVKGKRGKKKLAM